MLTRLPSVSRNETYLPTPGICIGSPRTLPPSAPERVLKAHSSDQVAHLFGDPRSAPGRTRLPSPVSGETHSTPTQDGLGPDDAYPVKDARAATIELNEQSTIGPTQMRSA